MNKLKYYLLFTFSIAQLLNAQEFYNINTINTIEINFEESNWDSLLDSYVAAGDEERLLGTVTINGAFFDSVGVRYKGNSSYNANQIKNPLNLKLDYIIDDQLIQGYGTLKLANVYKDPSFIRETLSYEIARKYFPAGQANYAKVYINNTYLGLYTSCQDVDKFFMRTHFSSDENVRVKAEIGDNSLPGSMGGVWEYLGLDSTSYYDKYVLESDYGWSELIDLLDTLTNTSDHIDQILNVDRHLWFLAFQNLLVNLDSPINTPQNHYLYRDDNRRFNPIPWDLNESFGVFTMLQSSGPLNPDQLKHLSPLVNLNNSEYPIISQILTNPEYRKIYVAHMKTMLEDNFENDWYYDRALEIQQIIDAEVMADPNKFYSYNDFLNNLDNSVGGGGPPPGSMSIIGISELMDARIPYLNGLSDFLATSPEIVSAAHEIDGSLVRFIAEVLEGDDVSVAIRSSVTEPFQKTAMYDDGQHGDSLANDGIYGTDQLSVNSNRQYYIFAENSAAVAFLPARAEYEYFTVQILSDVVINEFLAKNNNVQDDQDGEFDDWIEIYNNTDSTIALTGYFMSDDASNLTQWTFPDTSILSHSHLVVWADDDIQQSGLHANFKLSGEGEVIYLLNRDTTIIDEVTFGTQVDDISMGRSPDGTGEFVSMVPSFDAPNVSPLSTKPMFVPAGFVLNQNYPNPFNPATTIRYDLPEQSEVYLTVYDIKGREVRVLQSQERPAGHYEVQWDGIDGSGNPVSTGTYFCRLVANDYSKTIKMVYLK